MYRSNEINLYVRSPIDVILIIQVITEKLRRGNLKERRRKTVANSRGIPKYEGN